MVHALREANRVLASGGVLLDVRPAAETCRLELASVGASPVGELDATEPVLGNTAAADEAIGQAVAVGWFALVTATRFKLEFRWSSVADLADYLSGGTHPKRVRPACDELLRAYGAQASLRCERSLTLGAYRKLTI